MILTLKNTSAFFFVHFLLALDGWKYSYRASTSSCTAAKLYPNIAPNFNETKLDMECSFDASDNFMIHADEKATGNSCDDQRQNVFCFLLLYAKSCLFHEPLLPMKVELIKSVSML